MPQQVPKKRKPSQSPTARTLPPPAPSAAPGASEAVAGAGRAGLLRKIEWVLFGLACAAIVALHVVLFQHMGAFWRDEASSIRVARSPTFAALWQALVHDSFPALFDTLLKLWIASGIGKSETGLRLFGTLVSLGVIVAVPLACRRLSGLRDAGAPLLALSLSVFNVSVFYDGSSIRAYGLASMLIVLCLAAFWRLVENPNPRTAAVALLLSLLSVHSNYQNMYLLLGIGLAGAATCMSCKLWKRSLLVLGLCFVTALSMLIYLPIIKAYQASTGFGTGALVLPMDVLLRKMVQSLVGDSLGLLLLWGLLLPLAVATLSVRWFTQWRSGAGRSKPSLEVFCLIALIVGSGAGAVFFEHNGNLPHPWHFVPFIVFAAVILEAGLRTTRDSVWPASAKVAVACLILALSLPQLWETSHLRRTNMDLVIQTAVRQAELGDLIVVNPFWMVGSFCHYYHGEPDWITIPAFPHEELYRNEGGGPIAKLMRTPHALEPTKQRIARTLSAGKRLWIVGWIRFVEPGRQPPAIDAAPNPQSGTSTEDYSDIWTLETGYFLQQHARQATQIPVPVGQPVNGYENLTLIEIDGWR